MANKPVGQQDIADALGIARSTVTKVLNRDPVYRVSPEMKEIIWKKAQEMGYKLRKRRTNTIALVVASKMIATYNELYLHACKEAQDYQNRLFVVNTEVYPSYNELSLYVNPLAADGVMLLGDFDNEVIEQFTKALPTVLLDERHAEVSVDRIYGDMTLLTGKLAAHLVNLGHSKIAIIVDTLTDSIGKESVSALNSVLREANYEPDRSLIWEKRSARHCDIVREILTHPANPTAIIACTTEEHLTILNLLQSHKVDVPGEISYIGWDSSHFSGLAHFPDITHLDGYAKCLAKTSVTRLMERIDNHHLPIQEIRAEIGLHPGATCARVNNTARINDLQHM